MTFRPSELTDDEVTDCRDALLNGLAGGVFHLHLSMLGPVRMRWVLVPVPNHHNSLCGTRRCIKLGAATEVRVR